MLMFMSDSHILIVIYHIISHHITSFQIIIMYYHIISYHKKISYNSNSNESIPCTNKLFIITLNILPNKFAALSFYTRNKMSSILIVEVAPYILL